MMISESFTYFLIPFLLTFFFVPLNNRLGKKFKLIDKPSSRKKNNRDIVRIGGLSITCSITISYLLINYLSNGSYISNLWLLIFPLFFFVIGFIDDLLTIGPFKRLALQVLITLIIVCFNYPIMEISLPLISSLDYLNLSSVINLLITVTWIVGITNAFNWIDGLDGLAAGISFICFLSFAFLAIYSNNSSLLIIFILYLGSILAFLAFNKYPAKIYMGDGGSYFLGSSLAINSIVLNNQNQTDHNFTLSILLIFFIPVIDMFLVIMKRLSLRKSPFFPDRLHFHHRLIDNGIKHPRVVKILTSICCLFNLIGILTIL